MDQQSDIGFMKWLISLWNPWRTDQEINYRIKIREGKEFIITDHIATKNTIRKCYKLLYTLLIYMK